MTYEEGPALLAAHNLSLDGLRHASSLGGIPAPSVAIIRTDVQFDAYGDVTLIMGSDAANLGAKDFPVFDADVYSPRQPPALYRVDSDEIDKLNEKFSAAAERFDERGAGLTENDLSNNGPRAIERSFVAKATFLEEKDVAFEPPKRRPEGVDARLAKYVGFEGSKSELAADPGFLVDASASRMERLESRAALITSFRDRLEADIEEEFDLSGDAPVLRETGALNAADAVKRAGAERADGAKARVEADALIAPREDEFKAWCAEAFSEVERGRYFKDAQGRERPYELDALAREMTRDLKDAEGLYYGAGNVRAVLSEKLKGKSGVEEAAERIRPEAEVESAKARTTANVNALADRAFPDARWDRKGELLAEMAAAAGTDPARMEAWHEKEFGAPLPEGVAETAQETFLDLKAAPTGYLEAKPQRAVELSEFRAAVVPREQVEEAERALAEHGVDVIPYDGPEDRERAVREVAQECAVGRVRGGVEKEAAFEPASQDPERGEDPVTLIHRSPDPDLEITGTSSGLPLCFVDAGQDFTAQDLASMETDDLEGVLDVSYAPDQSRSSHIYGFSCDESEIVDAGALDMDEQAAKDIREALGLDTDDRFDIDAHDRLDLLDDPDDERRLHLDPEEVLNGEHENVVDAIDPEASWRVQEIRAETAARAGYVAVRDWDENGEVLMVAPHEVEGDLNDRLFYVAQDPEHVQNRTPEMESAESYGEEMRLLIDARLEAAKNREEESREKEPEMATPGIDGPEPVDPLNYVAPPKTVDPFDPERAAPSLEIPEGSGIRLVTSEQESDAIEERLKAFHAAAEIEDGKRWEQELSHNLVTTDPFEQGQEAPGVFEYDPTGETEVPAEFRHSRPEAPEKLGPTTFEELRRDSIENGASPELVGGPAFLREERLKDMITELDHELEPILPEGYSLDATVPGRGEDQDFPVGVLRGPNGFEERFEKFGLKDQFRVEGVAFTHEDREKGREQDAREMGFHRGEAGRDAGESRDGDDRDRDEGREI